MEYFDHSKLGIFNSTWQSWVVASSDFVGSSSYGFFKEKVSSDYSSDYIFGKSSGSDYKENCSEPNFRLTSK